jgi:hypothetical protein
MGEEKLYHDMFYNWWFLPSIVASLPELRGDGSCKLNCA